MLCLPNNAESRSIALSIGRNLTQNHRIMEALMRQADVLVDATQCRNPSQPVISNAWLAGLPEHAIIADLAVDPYLLDHTTPIVRGIEGIAAGDLDKYVFMAIGPEWDRIGPASITFEHRRTKVSCYL